MGVGIRSMQRLIGAASFGAAAVSKLAYSLKEAAAKTSIDASDKAKDSYSKEANKTAENKRLIQDRINEIKNKKLDLEEKALKIKARDLRTKDKESKLNAQKVKDKVAAYEEKQAATKPAENATPKAITPENSVTNIDAKDEDVGNLIEVKQKSLARSMAGHKYSTEYHQALSKAKSLVLGQKEDVWNEIGLDPNITDEDIRKAGYTKTDILKDFATYINMPEEWALKYNAEASSKNIEHTVNEYDADYVAMQMNNTFGEAWNAKILDKKRKEEYQKAEEEYYKNLDKKENYSVWDTESASSEDFKDDGEIVF